MPTRAAMPSDSEDAFQPSAFQPFAGGRDQGRGRTRGGMRGGDQRRGRGLATSDGDSAVAPQSEAEVQLHKAEFMKLLKAHTDKKQKNSILLTEEEHAQCIEVLSNYHRLDQQVRSINIADTGICVFHFLNDGMIGLTDGLRRGGSG